MTDQTLTILLIEDNPGDARLIEEMLNGATEHLHRISLDESGTDEWELHHEPDLQRGIAFLTEFDVDIVLLDLGLPESTGLDTLLTVVDETEFTPVIVLTGLDDRNLGIRGIQSGAQDYLVKDEVTGELLVHSMQYAIERTNRKREQANHREQLEVLNRVNEISLDITHDIITISERETLEHAVCKRLVESEIYRIAWIGEVDQTNNKITSKVVAGNGAETVDGVSIDSSENRDSPEKTDNPEKTDSTIPALEAIHSGEITVSRNVASDVSFETWDGETPEYNTIAYVPIAYEDFVYGVLSIYATSTAVFSDAEQRVLSRLGDIIGHAITAIERREALVSDTLLELEFEAETVFQDLLDFTAQRQCSITFENMVRGKDAVVIYGQAEGVSPDEFPEGIVGSEEVRDIRVISTNPEDVEFELVTTAIQSLVDAIAIHGGRIQQMTIGDGTVRFTIEFPPGRDKRQLVEIVESHCPHVSSLAHRVVDRSDRSVKSSQSIFEEQLTEKQQTALEAAYYAGLFDWPKKSTGEDVANRLGVSAATFNQHVRAAEKRFFESMFD